MTDEPEDDGDALFDGPCAVCGETVKGTRYFALGLFAAIAEDSHGLHFEPDEPLSDFEEWDDVPLTTNCVHVLCMQNYHDGMMAEMAHRRRHGEAAE